MSATTTTIPVTMTNEAAARIDELGIRSEVDRMIEYTLETLSGLRRLEIVADGPYDSHDGVYLTINGYRDPLQCASIREDENRWSAWQRATFSPDVFRHILLQLDEDSPHAG